MKIIGIYAIAPSFISTGEKFSLRFKMLTEPYAVGSACWVTFPSLKSPFNLSPRGITYLDNVYDGDIGEIEIDVDGRTLRFHNYNGTFFNDRRKFGIVDGLSFSSEGIKFIKIKIPGILETLSNPIVVKDKLECRIFWGDLHSQTFFSDGLRCPEELYWFARDEAFLDFFSVSDHSEWITNRQWDYFCSVANDFNFDGKFVTLIAQEWTNNKFGHRNIYFPGTTGKILRAGSESIENVYNVAHQYNAIVIPHHSANANMGVNWELAHDSEVERLVEVYSIWGNSEMSKEDGNTRPIRVMGGEKKSQHVIDALNRGYRFGFVGGGDIHDGRPGDELHIYQQKPPDYRNLYRQGITAVFAKNLTRNEIFDALYERRCYATSNIRMILTFSINGVNSGLTVKDHSKLCFNIFGASEIPVSRVNIISDGKIYKSFKPMQNHFTIEFEQVYNGEKYFYVRAERTDGEIAWSSPVWIEK